MSKPKYTNILTENQKFENITFDANIIERDFETDGDILFAHCTFKGLTSFTNIKARDISFFECKFENFFDIYESTFFDIGFTKCKFSNVFRLNSNVSSHYCVIRNVIGTEIEVSGDYRNFQVVGSTIDKIKLTDVNDNYSQKDTKIEFLVQNNINELKFKSFSNYSKIIFKGGKYDTIYFYGQFNNHIHFKKKIISEYIFFESSILKGRIDFNEGIFQYLNFHRSSFHGLVYINGYDLLENKSSDISIKDFTIHSCHFEKDVTIRLKDLDYLNLSNNNFNQILNFNNVNEELDSSSITKVGLRGSNQGNVIIENIYADFSLSDINLGNLYLKNIAFHTLYINEFHNTGNVSITNLESGVYLTIQDSIVGNFNFLNEDLNVFKEIVISNSNLKGLVLSIYPKKIRSYSSDPIVGYGLKDKSRNNHNLKNIYNQLKQVANSRGDIDPMNKYKALEHNKLIITKRIGFDSILLFLNWISNNNGQSWFRGVLFTLIGAFLFFLLYLNSLGLNFEINDQYENYVLFVTSFPKLELEEFSELNKLWKVSLIIWFSRIFISYGIYQTISAFRKYGR